MYYINLNECISFIFVKKKYFFFLICIMLLLCAYEWAHWLMVSMVTLAQHVGTWHVSYSFFYIDKIIVVFKNLYTKVKESKIKHRSRHITLQFLYIFFLMEQFLYFYYLHYDLWMLFSTSHKNYLVVSSCNNMHKIPS